MDQNVCDAHRLFDDPPLDYAPGDPCPECCAPMKCSVGCAHCGTNHPIDWSRSDPCPVSEDERKEIDDFIEQWGVPIGTDHWRIGQTMAWKISRYMKWLHERSQRFDEIPQAPADEGCPHGDAHIVHDCLRCGAPVCCGKCCAKAETSIPQAKVSSPQEPSNG